MTATRQPGSDATDVDAILFDLDGVLVDSAETIRRLWTRWAERRGLDPVEVLPQTHGRPAAETIAALAPHLDAAVEADSLEADQVHGLSELCAIPGAQALTRGLSTDRWGVVTSGSRYVATTRLRAVGIELPAVLVTADDVSTGKPDPEGYRRGAADLGVDPHRCVVIEDAHSGVRAARAGGMNVIGVEGEQLGPRDGLLFTVRDLTELQVGTSRADSLVLRKVERRQGSPS